MSNEKLPGVFRSVEFFFEHRWTVEFIKVFGNGYKVLVTNVVNGYEVLTEFPPDKANVPCQRKARQLCRDVLKMQSQKNKQTKAPTTRPASAESIV